MCVEVHEGRGQTATPDAVQLNSCVAVAFRGDRIDKVCSVRAI